MNVEHMRPADFESPVWKRFERFVRLRIEVLRDALEESETSAEDTSLIRGQLFECRHLLSLPAEAARQDPQLPGFPPADDTE